MENLEDIEKVTEIGKYKYGGCMLLNDPIKTEEKKTLGQCMLFFKELEDEDIYFMLTSDIVGSNYEEPYGCFQKLIGTFNSNYDLEKLDNSGWWIEDKDKPKAEVIEE